MPQPYHQINGPGKRVTRAAFGTLKFDEANLRTGPGREYPVLWQYRKSGLPLLVDAEFGIWRKVVDHEGNGGWNSWRWTITETQGAGPHPYGWGIHDDEILIRQ